MGSLVKPLVKWVGGKRKIADQIIATFPSSRAPGAWRYAEPFLGGASVYLATQAAGHRFTDAHLSDACAPLIDAYVTAVYSPFHLARALKAIDSWSYGAVVKTFNRRETERRELRAALFLYLNRRGFNGLYRENAAGLYNVPIGSNPDRPLHALEEIEAFGRALARTTLRSCDYRDTWTVAPTSFDATAPTIVYCDPPYVPIKADSFVNYTAGGFDHGAFARWCHDLAERGVCVRVSNSDCPTTRELFRGFTVLEIANVTRNVSGAAKGRKPVTELLLCAN